MWFLSSLQRTEGRGGVGKDLVTVTLPEERSRTEEFLRDPSASAGGSSCPHADGPCSAPDMGSVSLRSPTNRIQTDRFFSRSSEEGLRESNSLNKPSPHHPPRPGHALHLAVYLCQVSCQHNPLCVFQHKSGPRPLTEEWD